MSKKLLIGIAVFASLVAGALVYVYTNAQTTVFCDGAPTLSLSDRTPETETSITATISGLSSGCSGKQARFYFYGGTYQGQCFVESAGNCWITLTVPSAIGTYTYMAGVDMNSDVDISDPGEFDTESLTARSSTDTTPPTVSISSHANGAIVPFSSSVMVSASTSDNVGVDYVQFFVDGILKANDFASPYSFSWNTYTVASGSHTLRAKAFDAAGNYSVSQDVNVTVSDAVTPTPTPVASPTPTVDFSVSIADQLLILDYGVPARLLTSVRVEKRTSINIAPVTLIAAVSPVPAHAPLPSWLDNQNICGTGDLPAGYWSTCSRNLDIAIDAYTPAGDYTITVTAVSVNNDIRTDRATLRILVPTSPSPTPNVTPTPTPGTNPSPTPSPTPTPGASPTPTVNPTASPRPSPTPSLTPTAVLTCMRTAVDKRDNAIIAAWDNLTVAPTSTFATTSIKIALETRTNDVKQAWTIAVKKERQTAIRAAWTKFRAARIAARNEFRNTRKRVWADFKAEGKICTNGANITSESIGQEVKF